MLDGEKAIAVVYKAFMFEAPEEGYFNGCEEAESCAQRMELAQVPALIRFIGERAVEIVGVRRVAGVSATGGGSWQEQLGALRDTRTENSMATRDG